LPPHTTTPRPPPPTQPPKLSPPPSALSLVLFPQAGVFPPPPRGKGGVKRVGSVGPRESSLLCLPKTTFLGVWGKTPTTHTTGGRLWPAWGFVLWIPPPPPSGGVPTTPHSGFPPPTGGEQQPENSRGGGGKIRKHRGAREVGFPGVFGVFFLLKKKRRGGGGPRCLAQNNGEKTWGPGAPRGGGPGPRGGPGFGLRVWGVKKIRFCFGQKKLFFLHLFVFGGFV